MGTESKDRDGGPEKPARAESKGRDGGPEKPARAEGKRALDTSQELFCREIAARVRRWIAEGRPVRRKGA